MEYDPCPDDRTDCPLYPNCKEDRDHVYWPATDYRTSLEREFRSLPENIVLRCIYKHRLRHIEEAPPEKPSREEMLKAIGRLGI
jgi:hypothetical protein